MLSNLQLWVELGLLLSWTEAVQSSAVHVPHSPNYDPSSRRMTTCTSEQVDPWPTSSVYPSDPITINSTTVQVPSSMNTSNVSITSTACFNSTATTTIIVSIVSTDWSTTTCTTTTTDTTTDTVTDIITDILTDTVTDTITDTITDTTTETTTDTVTDTVTDTTTETTTDTTTVTTTDTVTTPTTITVAPNPCPTTCSMSVGTVNLFYWPTDQPDLVYPSTYVDSHLDYTFTSPSVYMVVNTMYGYNTAGRAGPSGTSIVFPLDLDQVSTIDLVNSATRQLTLNDLGTDCPQTQDPSAIATAVPNGRCDPILVAPEKVKSWASPCNACGPFGMFDPPYAVAPLTGGLVPVTTTVAMTQPETQSTPSATPATETTATPMDTTTVAVTTESTYSSAEPTSPAMETTSSSAEPTLPVVETTSSQVDVTSSNVMPTTASSSTGQGTGSSSSLSTVSSPATTSTAFNSATKESGRGAWLGLSLFMLAILL